MTSRRGFLGFLGKAAVGIGGLALAGCVPPAEAKPVGQQFARGQRVKLNSTFPVCMDHFSGKGSEAIVEYSYNDRYGGEGEHQYRLLILGPDRYVPYPHSSAWYPESLMTLISDDTDHGKQMILLYEIERRKRGQ